MARIAFLFPGQGSAAIGMGADIAKSSRSATEIIHKLGDIQPAIVQVMTDGPKEDLIRTANAQPAIFTVNCACLAALLDAGIEPDAVAGHSLGEYAALVAAGVVDFESGLGLVVERGSTMERSTSARPGKMAAILGLESHRADEIIGRWSERGTISNANDNAPGQIVISGESAVVDGAVVEFRSAGARVLELPVGGAFHSGLMRPAEEQFAVTLDRTPFADARIPLTSNFTAQPSRDADTIKDALHHQITGSVRWRESIDAMLEMGIDVFIEVGPGKVLSGIVQRCTKGRDVTVLNVEDSASLQKSVAAVESQRAMSPSRAAT